MRYSFPPPHPFNSARVVRFWEELEKHGLGEVAVEPERADEEAVELFHDKEHFEFVRKASTLGYGVPGRRGHPRLQGRPRGRRVCGRLDPVLRREDLSGEVDHGFNPVGGLHHARRDRSAGFCVFNDIGVAIELLRRRGVRRILYVDIDVHHGDGVFYPYQADPEVFIFDVHEDGRFLYPGSGTAEETGEGKAAGTKVNIPLLPGEGDERMKDILPRLEEFATRADPEFVILQCGADGMAGDPIGGLSFSESFHSNVARLLHDVAHKSCKGRMVALGGGGYDPNNCARAWTAVVRQLVGSGNREAES